MCHPKYYISEMAPSFRDMRHGHSLQHETPSQRDILNKLKPAAMHGCIRVPVVCVWDCVQSVRIAQFACHSVPVTASPCLRRPVSPGICQNGERHQRKAGTRLETRPRVWCALTTGATRGGENTKRQREVSRHRLDKRVMHRTDIVASLKNSRVLKQCDWCEHMLTDNH